MIKFSGILCILLILYSSIHGQMIISGKVTDEKTGQGIGFASVSILSAKDSGLVKGQVTDSAGVFMFQNIPTGKYILLLSSYGYKKIYKDVIPAEDIINLGNIPMSGDLTLLSEVVVAGQKPAFQRIGDKLAVSVSGNPLFHTAANTFDILKKVPGLEVNSDGTIQMSGRITPVIFINGKPVQMSPEELQQYLGSLSPGMIASIEVINNPSSRYDGEYKGIIDIKLKQDLTLGWKGNANIVLQQNAYTLADNNFSLTYKTGKLVYSARLGYVTGERIYRYKGLQHLANTNIMATNTQTITRNNNLSYQLGIDYYLSKDHQVNIVGRAYRQNRQIDAFNTLHTTDSTAQHLVSHTNTFTYSTPLQDNYAANLNYSGQFRKTTLEVLSTFLMIRNQQKEDIQTKNTITDHLLDYWKTNLYNNILIRSVQADLSGNAGKGKWAAGGKFAFTTTKNNLYYDTLHTSGVFAPDASRSNNFKYDEYISAAYASYENTYHQLSYTVSLRAEHTHSTANAITEHTVTTRDYLTWLPGLSITIPMKASQQLHISYSRRMTRPNFAQLNPFRFYNSPLNYFVGNPYLQPSTTQMLNIAYTRKALQVSLQVGRESDPMTRYPEYDSVTNVLQYLGKNLPYNDFAGIEISFPLTVNKWWRMSHNIRGGYKKEQTPYHGVTYAIPIFDYNLTGSQVFTLPQQITIDISYYYRSLSGTGLYVSRSLASVDAGIRKSWLKGKFNTGINFYDMFDTYRVRYIFREKKIIDNAFTHWVGARRAALTLSYSFGKSTHSSKQRAKNEEENRAGI
ncbi:MULTISPECIES: outer membrane beta-barrel protein [unclassified Chitinophaga]|uniref:outer membrane beta-barrel protein n=1 Tax=unclassified Chitinophaga TaxID=2619133 RepID=UPI0030100881